MSEYCDGTQADQPIDVGHYLSNDVTRTDAQTGASPYGIANLSGNVTEHLINCAGTTTPTNGTGSVSSVPASWPGASSGKGIRGGDFSTNSSSQVRVSDRLYAGWSSSVSTQWVGIRPVRSAE